jgi:hypothetical protein
MQDGPNTGLLYYWGSSAPGQAFRITDGVLSPVAASRTTFNIGFPGAQPSISSNGMDGNTGIMWVERVDNYGSNGPETLLAFRAEDFSTPIWTSTNVMGRDVVAGTSVKFVMPIVSNGHVYAASNGSLAVYGLLPAHSVVPDPRTDFQVLQVDPLQGGDTRLQLSWTNPDDAATLIKIERSAVGADGPFTQVAQVGPGQTTFTDTGLTPLTHYWYRIRATNQAGDSAYSPVQDAATRLTASRLNVTTVISREVDLSWTRVGNDGYDLERSTDGGPYIVLNGPTHIPTTQTSYADSDVTVGHSYLYRLRAFNMNPTDSSVSNLASALNAPVDVESPFPDGIQNTDGLHFNGSAFFSSTEHIIRLNNDFSQAGSVFTTARVDDTRFSTTFWIRLHEGTQPNPADGLTFTIQSNSPTALGAGGGGLGYNGISNSVAVKFDVFNKNTTGLILNGNRGAAAGEISVDLDRAVVNLQDQHRKRVDISYDAATQMLNVRITDEQHDGGPTSVSQSYTVNIPAIVGTGGGYVGFTGGTGGNYTLADLTGWVFPPTAPAGPSNLRATAGANDVTLNWTNNAVGEDGYTVQRSLDNFHFDTIASLGVGATTYHDTGLTNNTIYFYRVQAFSALGGSAIASVQATLGGSVVTIDHSDGFASNGDLQANGDATFVNPSPAPGTIGIFTAHQDIGTTGDPGTAGTATFDNTTAMYTLTASGSDIWDTADHMQYIYKPMNGDGEIIARVVSINNTDYWSKAGIMIRQDTSAGSLDAFMLETGGVAPNAHNEPVFQWRPSAGGGTSDTGNHPGGDVGNRAPIWLRLVRSGNTFTGYWAADVNNGQSHGSWRNLGSNQTVPMGTSVLVGLGLTAHNNSTVASAQFDHVTVVTAARLTDTVNNQASSLFTRQRVPITGSFNTSWVMNLRPNNGAANAADGITFTIQADAAGAGAIGQGGGGLGYATDTPGGTQGIHPSVMVKFDMYSQGSHHATTGLYTNGESPNVLSHQIDMTSAGIDFTQNHTYQVDLAYDGLTLTETVKDLVSGRTFSTTYAIAIRDTIGSDTAYVGFTGGTGGQNAWQTIESWTATFNSLAPPPHLEVIYPTTTSGAPVVFTVAAKTAGGAALTNYRGTIHFTSSDPLAILPADYTFTTGDNGTHLFAGVLFHVGTDTVTVTDNSPSPFTDTHTILVNPKSFVVSDFPSPTTAGDSHAFTVTALDYFNNVATDYQGRVHFTSSDPRAALPGDYTFTGDDAGVHVFTATLFTAGTQSITVVDPLTSSQSRGTQSGIEVDPAALSSFVVTGFPSTTVAGETHTFTVTAKDAYGNTVTGYVGTVHFTSDDSQAGLPDDYSFTAEDNGVHVFSASLNSAGTRSITVTDVDTGASGTQSGILVRAGQARRFLLDGLQSTVVADQPQPVIVYAMDAYGNRSTNYTGTVHFSSSDDMAVLPPNYTFTAADNGFHVFLVTFRRRGTQSLTVTDTMDGTILGSQDDIMVV